PAIVNRCRGKGCGRIDVSDHGHHPGVVPQLDRDLDRSFGPRLVVLDDERQPPPVDPARAVDLVHGHLGRELHGPAVLVVDRPGDPDGDRLRVRGAAAGEHDGRGGRGDQCGAGSPPEAHHRSSEAALGPSRLRSNSSRIRRYSSVHEDGSTKPWSSTGYTAISQFSFPSSISRCASRTTSEKWTFTSTMPWAMRSAPRKPSAK